jgi:hypothetical protein
MDYDINKQKNFRILREQLTAINKEDLSENRVNIFLFIIS